MPVSCRISGGMNVRSYRITQWIAWVLLTSFLFAAAADIVLFEIFDLVHLPFVRDSLGMSRIVGFAKVLLSLWISTAAAIAFTLVIRRVFEAPKAARWLIPRRP